jgi:hypothetical protein
LSTPSKNDRTGPPAAPDALRCETGEHEDVAVPRG